MSPEKEEACPRCGSTGDAWDYDRQRCASLSSPTCSAADCGQSSGLALELAMAEQTADDHWRLVQEMQAGLQEIYSMRGEDELIARIASPLIDKARP